MDKWDNFGTQEIKALKQALKQLITDKYDFVAYEMLKELEELNG